MLNVKGQKQYDKAPPKIMRRRKPDTTHYESRFISLKLMKDCEVMKAHYGSHANVARVLGLTPRHYFRIRHGYSQVTDTVFNLLVLIAKLLRNKHRSKELARMIPPLIDRKALREA